MKKKLLSLLTLILCVCSGAWATDEVIFSYTPSTSENTANTEYTATGGKAKLGAAKVDDTGFKSDNGMNSTKYINVILSGNTLQAGDVITIKARSGSNNGGIYIAKVNNADGTENTNYQTAGNLSAKNNDEDLTYTVTSTDCLHGLSSFYLFRNGTTSSTGVSTYIKKIDITRPVTKTVTSKVLTGININGSAWDIAGLTENAATISTAQKGLPLVEFVYTTNYDDSSSDTNQKETVAATKSGANYVAASTVLTTNATLTFTDVLPYIFNMTDVTGPTDNISHGTGADVIASFNDVANTSAHVHNGHGSNDNVVLVYNTNYITLNSSGNSYFKANFAVPLAEGDVINCSNTTATTFKIGTSTSSGSATTVTFPYVIPANSALIGETTFYMFKTGSGGTPEFTTFSIARIPKHSVTYSIGSGTGTTPIQADVPETATFTVAGSTGFTAPSGKAFSCWNDGTNDYAAGATYTMGTEDVTLTAVYETAITATFANGGHGTAPDAQVTTGSIVLSPIKADWYENETWIADLDVQVDDATVTAGTAIAAGKTAVMSENTKFTAQWTYTGKPYIENVALPVPAENALNIATQALFTPSNGYVVLNPNSVRGNSTTGYWLTARNANKLGFTWNAPEGSVFYSNPTDKENAVTVQQQKTYAVKFTGTTEFKALMNSRKANNSVKALLVDYNGATPQKVGDVIEIGNFGNETAALTNDAIATFSELDATHTYAVFFYGFDTSTNAVLYEVAFQIPVPDAPTTSGDDTYLTTSDNMAGWRAFYDASNSYTVDENTKVYVATANSTTSVTLTELSAGIPIGTAVLLHTTSSADSHKMTLTKDYTVGAFSGTNLLSWTTSAVSDVYRLGYGDSGVGFYPYSGTPSSGAVILNTSSASSARALTISFSNDGVNGIDTVETEKGLLDGEYYDLQGRRVAQPTKGLYILNGKKVVMK
ncbi:MAG: hypothetical protein IJP74_12570 [Prevotella sp.]|nr:hypothetical protein [Prevotella sp.]